MIWRIALLFVLAPIAAILMCTAVDAPFIPQIFLSVAGVACVYGMIGLSGTLINGDRRISHNRLRR